MLLLRRILVPTLSLLALLGIAWLGPRVADVALLGTNE